MLHRRPVLQLLWQVCNAMAFIFTATINTLVIISITSGIIVTIITTTKIITINTINCFILKCHHHQQQQQQ